MCLMILFLLCYRERKEECHAMKRLSTVTVMMTIEVSIQVMLRVILFIQRLCCIYVFIFNLFYLNYLNYFIIYSKVFQI